MSDTKHTKGNLFVNTRNDQIGDVWSEEFDRPFAQIQQTGPPKEDIKQEERRANADELVRRWNTHPALLEALEEAKEGLHVAILVIKECAPQYDWSKSTPRIALDLVNEALATARA